MNKGLFVSEPYRSIKNTQGINYVDICHLSLKELLVRLILGRIEERGESYHSVQDIADIMDNVKSSLPSMILEYSGGTKEARKKRNIEEALQIIKDNI